MPEEKTKRPSPSPFHRLGLLVFGAMFLVVFVVVAIAEGIGDPSIPEGDVILVQNVPDGGGEISRAEFEHVLFLAATEEGLSRLPKPSNPQYEEMKEGALTNLMEAAWIEGQAAEMGISVSDSTVTKETDKLLAEKFPTEGERFRYLTESNLTQEDLERQVRTHILSSQIQEELENVPSFVPSRDEIQAYYEAAKASQYTDEESREVRALLFKSKDEAEMTKAELEKDDSAEHWKALAIKSDDPTDRKSGGVLEDGAKNPSTVEPLHAALFAAPEGQVQGPIRTSYGYEVYEVTKITPEKVIGLGEVEAQIKSQLEETAQQDKLTTFVDDFYGRWISRTFCAEGYVVEKCANYRGSGRSAEANPACYEADPETPAAECPAPVQQSKPALPGSVTLLAPEGTRLPQGPQPPGRGGKDMAPRVVGH